MLDARTKAALKTRLEKEKKLLEEELGKLGKRNPADRTDWVPSMPEGDEFGADRNDNAEIVEDIEDAASTVEELEGRLNLVEKALDKFETGMYGICEVSGEEIELDRLEANPAATTCKDHMS